MKIVNPWPRCLVRAICKPGGITVIQSSRGMLELPEGTVEAVLDPIYDKGRGKYVSVAPSNVWSSEWGIQDAQDHLKKMEIEEDRAKLEEEKEKEQKRKEKEARERTKQAVEAPKKPIMEPTKKPVKVTDTKADRGKELEL